MKNPLKNVSKKKKTLIIIGGIVVICIIVSFIKPKSDASQGVLVSAGTVSRGNLSQTISIKSTVEGSDSANVFFCRKLQNKQRYRKGGRCRAGRPDSCQTRC